MTSWACVASHGPFCKSASNNVGEAPSDPIETPIFRSGWRGHTFPRLTRQEKTSVRTSGLHGVRGPIAEGFQRRAVVALVRSTKKPSKQPIQNLQGKTGLLEASSAMRLSPAAAVYKLGKAPILYLQQQDGSPEASSAARFSPMAVRFQLPRCRFRLS